MDKKTKKRIFYVVIILLLIWIYNNVSLNRQLPFSCDTYDCGGFNANGEVNQCPSGCKCGEGDPMIPDMPTKCIPK